jgi:hypothetical protein
MFRRNSTVEADDPVWYYTQDQAADLLANPLAVAGQELPLQGAAFGQETPEIVKSVRRKGPIYRQDKFLCMPWSTIHAMQAVGRPPSPQLARTLLNAALPSTVDGEDGGLSIYSAERIASTHPDSQVRFSTDCRLVHGGRHVVPMFERFVRRRIDGGSALVAQVHSRTRSDMAHAIALVGYEAYAEGPMGVQIIDPTLGEVLEMSQHLMGRLVSGCVANSILATVSPR